MAWKWDRTIGNYVDDATGQEIDRIRLYDFSLDSIGGSKGIASGWAAGVSGGQLSPAQWRDNMREEMKKEYIRQYVLARGGLPQMTEGDWGSIGGQLADQYRYLDAMTDEIAADLLSEGVIRVERVRGGMYIHAGREAFSRGRAAGKGLDFSRLPAYPADGSMICLTNCNCDWEIEIIRDADDNITAWACTWKLNTGSKTCTVCESYANDWNPYMIEA